MMDQLVNTVAEKTGLSPEQARSAAEAVIGFLKEKLPEPAASLVGNAVGGGNAEGEGAGGLMDQASGMLGGMFGGK